MPHYLGTSDVAALLGCSRVSVNRMAREGRLRVAGTKGRRHERLYDADAIAVVVQERAAQ